MQWESQTLQRGTPPDEILAEGWTKIASRLMLNESLSEEAAYFAADHIMRVATEKTEAE